MIQRSRIARRRRWPKRSNSRGQSPTSNVSKAPLARKKQFEGPKSYLEYLEGAAGPKEAIRGTKVLPRISRRRCWPERGNSMDQSPTSNISKALLARKRQFEGPKSYLEYLEGAAGPKEAIRGTKVLPRISRRRCWPERGNSRDQSPTSNISKALLARKKDSGDRKTLSKEQKTESSKNSVYIQMAQKGRAQKTSKKTQLKGRLSARGAYLRDSEELSPILAL
jgi:hypothetical protein